MLPRQISHAALPVQRCQARAGPSSLSVRAFSSSSPSLARTRSRSQKNKKKHEFLRRTQFTDLSKVTDPDKLRQLRSEVIQQKTGSKFFQTVLPLRRQEDLRWAMLELERMHTGQKEVRDIDEEMLEGIANPLPGHPRGIGFIPPHQMPVFGAQERARAKRRGISEKLYRQVRLLAKRLVEKREDLRKLFFAPTPQQRARILSAPAAVAKRREALGIDISKAGSLWDGLTISDRLQYESLKESGAFSNVVLWPTGPPTPSQWLEVTRRGRRRLRGLGSVSRTELIESGKKANHPQPSSDRSKDPKELKVVGRPIYLPNILFTLVPNYTPKGQPYNPWEATFYVPHGVTKLDVRSYLKAMYGLEVTYIRTEVRYSPIGIHRTDEGTQRAGTKRKEAHKSYKRAVVGLKEPFLFPLMVEDMNTEERRYFLQYLNDSFDYEHGLKERFNASQFPYMIPQPWAGSVRGRKKVIPQKNQRRDEREEKVRLAALSPLKTEKTVQDIVSGMMGQVMRQTNMSLQQSQSRRRV